LNSKLLHLPVFSEGKVDVDERAVLNENETD
jgi:hypothetical protein